MRKGAYSVLTDIRELQRRHTNKQLTDVGLLTVVARHAGRRQLNCAAYGFLTARSSLRPPTNRPTGGRASLCSSVLYVASVCRLIRSHSSSINIEIFVVACVVSASQQHSHSYVRYTYHRYVHART